MKNKVLAVFHAFAAGAFLVWAIWLLSMGIMGGIALLMGSLWNLLFCYQKINELK